MAQKSKHEQDQETADHITKMMWSEGATVSAAVLTVCRMSAETITTPEVVTNLMMDLSQHLNSTSIMEVLLPRYDDTHARNMAFSNCLHTKNWTMIDALWPTCDPNIESGMIMMMLMNSLKADEDMPGSCRVAHIAQRLTVDNLIEVIRESEAEQSSYMDPAWRDRLFTYVPDEHKSRALETCGKMIGPAARAWRERSALEQNLGPSAAPRSPMRM